MDVDCSQWRIEFTSGIPVYRQIENLVLQAIASCKHDAGDRLPSIKAVAEQLEVNPNTVAKAYREMEYKGLIEGRRGAGSYVADATEAVSESDEAVKKERMATLWARSVAEARSLGIGPEELRRYIENSDVNREKGS